MKTFKTLALVLFYIFVLTAGSKAESNPDNNRLDFNRLTDFLLSSTGTVGLIALTDFENDYDAAVHHAGLDYFNSHPELIDQIRLDLGSEQLSWHLKEITHRLLYVPEKRPDVSDLFLEYCHGAINDLLEMTGFDNPFCSISMPSIDQPPLTGKGGIAAIIVQDLAREYVAGYQFSGTDSQHVIIRLSGCITVNEVGSYSGYVVFLPETGGWDCVRDQHTIWQSQADNPYTVLMTPLEETLHISVREHTEKAILAALNTGCKAPTADFTALVDEWLAVEEAVVGGLVVELVPKIFAKWFPDLPSEWIESDLKTKAGFEKYRYLEKGIRVVRLMGARETVKLYSENPQNFRNLLSRENRTPSDDI